MKDQQELFGVQMLRAVAALAVVTHHSLEESNGAHGHFSPDWLTTLGASGVDVFFVISGFIMLFVSFRPDRPPIGARAFLLRRFTRIYPLYWICCLGMLILEFCGFLSHHKLGVVDIIRSVFLIPSSKLLIGVSWTLIYEVYFYLCFSITLMMKSRVISVLGTTATIIVLYLAAPIFPQPERAFVSDPVAFEFCFGLWLALMYGPSSSRPGVLVGYINDRALINLALGILGFSGLLLASMFVPHQSTNGLVGFPRLCGWGIPAVLVVLAALNIKERGSGIARFAVTLGNASYALYLTHEFFMIAYAKSFRLTDIGNLDQIYVVPIVVIICVVAALLTHIFIENPLLALTRNSSRRRDRLPADIPTAA